MPVVQKTELTNEEVLQGLRADDEKVRNEFCKNDLPNLSNYLINKYKISGEDIDVVKDCATDAFIKAEEWIKGKGENFQGNFFGLYYWATLCYLVKYWERKKRKREYLSNLESEIKRSHFHVTMIDEFSRFMNMIAYRECLERLPLRWKLIISDLFESKNEEDKDKKITNEDRRKNLGFNNVDTYNTTKHNALDRLNDCLKSNPKYDSSI